MAGKKTKVIGIEDLKARMMELHSVKVVENISFRATIGISKEIREATKANIVAMGLLDTGDMYENVSIKRIVDGSKRGYTVGVRSGQPKQVKSGNDPFYWWWVHFGTKKMAPNPFLTNAFRAMQGRSFGMIKDSAIRALSVSLNAAIRKHNKGK